MIKKSGMMQDSMIVEQQNLSIIVGNRIPRSFFWTSGIGESDITVHAGSYHLALKEAGIERYNIMVYSSIMPAIAIETEKPSYDEVTHGSVLESITAVASGKERNKAHCRHNLRLAFQQKNRQEVRRIGCRVQRQR